MDAEGTGGKQRGKRCLWWVMGFFTSVCPHQVSFWSCIVYKRSKLCAAAPTSLSEPVLVDTFKRLQLWVGGCQEPWGLPGASLVIQLSGYKPNREPGLSPWVLLLHLH